MLDPTADPLELTDDLRKRLVGLLDGMGRDLVEREVPIRLAVLAALAGEHLLLVGPPGTAKSVVSRRLHLAFSEGTYFERLLTRFSVPEEIFGPLSIAELQKDKYLRKTQGYLPEASVAFIDEIFKANSAILNSLLTILNEREFDNGPERKKTPLICLVAASNEISPDGEESQVLEALFDRFLLRCSVPPVSDEGFDSLLALRGEPTVAIPMGSRLTSDDLERVRVGAAKVMLGPPVINLLKALRTFLAERQIPCSDRRWRKIVKLLQVAAFTEGRKEVDVLDGWIFRYTLWEGEKAEQANEIDAWFFHHAFIEAHQKPERFTSMVGAWEVRILGSSPDAPPDGPDTEPSIKKTWKPLTGNECRFLLKEITSTANAIENAEVSLAKAEEGLGDRGKGSVWMPTEAVHQAKASIRKNRTILIGLVDRMQGLELHLASVHVD